MLTYETIKKICRARGQEPPPAIRVIERALALAGYTRAERRRMIEVSKAAAAAAPEPVGPLAFREGHAEGRSDEATAPRTSPAQYRKEMT